MAEYHCDSPMDEKRTPLESGSVQVDYTCRICNQRERDIRSSRGHLLRWINLSLKARLAAGESLSV